MMDPILSMIGICRKAGKIEAGEEPVDAAVRARDARLLLLAADAADNTARRCAHFAEVGQCLWLRIPESKYELGRALGRGSCAVLAITDTGLALAVAQRLAEHDPAKYDEAVAKLQVKAQRARERQEEQLRHEKNLRQGKRREKSPPPPPEETPPKGWEGDRPPAPGKRPGGPRKGPGGPRKGPGRPGAGPRKGPGGAGRGPGKGPDDRGPGYRPSKKERRHAEVNARYAHARPVKRGKGSKPGGGRPGSGKGPKV